MRLDGFEYIRLSMISILIIEFVSCSSFGEMMMNRVGDLCPSVDETAWSKQ
jgi:hypothetical protein